MTFGEMCSRLNRAPIQIRKLQNRFEIPIFDGDDYSPAYLAFFRTLLDLRILNIGVDRIQELWRIERKILTLLHADSSGSPTWFLDACGQTQRPHRRLLLSNYDVGVDLTSNQLQPELDFVDRPRELFSAHEMGEDELRLLREYLAHLTEIARDAHAERTHTQNAAAWAARRLPTA